MDLFRVGHDVYGQRVLEGIAWEMLPLAALVGAVVIVAHMIYRSIRGSSRKRGGR